MILYSWVFCVCGFCFWRGYHFCILFTAYIKHYLGSSVENIELCKARVGHRILPPCNGDIGFLLKYTNSSTIQNKVTRNFNEGSMIRQNYIRQI